MSVFLCLCLYIPVSVFLCVLPVQWQDLPAWRVVSINFFCFSSILDAFTFGRLYPSSSVHHPFSKFLPGPCVGPDSARVHGNSFIFTLFYRFMSRSSWGLRRLYPLRLCLRLQIHAHLIDHLFQVESGVDARRKSRRPIKSEIGDTFSSLGLWLFMRYRLFPIYVPTQFMGYGFGPKRSSSHSHFHNMSTFVFGVHEPYLYWQYSRLHHWKVPPYTSCERSCVWQPLEKTFEYPFDI